MHECNCCEAIPSEVKYYKPNGCNLIIGDLIQVGVRKLVARSSFKPSWRKAIPVVLKLKLPVGEEDSKLAK